MWECGNVEMWRCGDVKMGKFFDSVFIIKSVSARQHRAFSHFHISTSAHWLKFLFGMNFSALIFATAF